MVRTARPTSTKTLNLLALGSDLNGTYLTTNFESIRLFLQLRTERHGDVFTNNFFSA